MIFCEPLETVVKRRYSVRTYHKQPIPQPVKDEISAYIKTLSSPFPSKPTFTLIESDASASGGKLGTYGMIKNASSFVVSQVQDEPYAVEAMGYELEQLILFITTLNLGTCWLGGTFDRAALSKTLDKSAQRFIPAISPIGYFERKTLRESIVRGLVRADSRKPWDTIFFDNDFNTPLTQQAAGPYAKLLEMLRLAPSASNKQPWRVVLKSGCYHFYEEQTPGYSSAYNFDMQAIDMGIAACHFQLAAQEQGIGGKFDLNAAPTLALPANTIYKFSWIPDESAIR